MIIPELPEKTAPAPLYVLSVESFTGSTHELDLLRPVFEKLEGVVVLTALQSSDEEMASLIAELARDFCVDAQRVVTSSVPTLTSLFRPPPRPASTWLVANTPGTRSSIVLSISVGPSTMRCIACGPIC